MKKALLLTTASLLLLNASNIKDSKLEETLGQKQKGIIESQILKDSWINPLEVAGQLDRNKGIDSSQGSSKKVYLNFNQDIFKSGGILYTIKKAKEQKRLAQENYKNEILSLNSNINNLVLSIKKIDLQLKKQDYLIKNKTLEINKKQEQYLNSTIDIEELDTAVIEKNDLLNAIEDLQTSKNDLLKNLKDISSKNYRDINIEQLKIVSLDEYLQNNQSLIVEEVNKNITKIDSQITKSNYLPKVSVYSQVGYEDNTLAKQDNDYYNYGLKVSIPLDYNKSKNIELSKVNYRLSKITYKIKMDNEKNRYENILKTIKTIDKKVLNANESIKRYESIYKLTNDLYKGMLKTKQDLETIENRLNSSKLDLDILALDKQIQIYELYKSLNK